MKINRNLFYFLLCALLLLLFLPLYLYADDHNGGHGQPMGMAPPMPTQMQTQTQGQRQSQRQNQTSTASASQTQGNQQNSTFEAGAPDVILIPNNNTESCLRVFGLAFSNQQGGGGIGFPWRSKACDFEQAASAADAGGNHRMAWYWRCHKKNIYKTFKKNGASKGQAIQGCATKMWAMLEPPRPPVHPPVQQVICKSQDNSHDETHARLFESCVSK